MDEILAELPETSKVLIFAETISACEYVSSMLTSADLYCLAFDPLNS